LPGADDVTMVIATRGPSAFFTESLDSALAELPAEVIVVEDGTRGVDEGDLRGARLLRLDAVGRSAARNAGVDAAATPFVAFQDDDDVTLPGRLGRLRSSLEQAAASPLSFGPVRVVDGEGRPNREWNDLLAGRARALSRQGASFAGILESRCPIYTSATMVRREAFLKVGGYDRQLDAYEDLDLYLRLARLGALAQCGGDPVTAYRLHGANTPSHRLYEGLVAVTAKHLPGARGLERRLLVEWRLEALWGLGRYPAVRAEGSRAALQDPLLLSRPGFVKRFLGAALPARVRELRR